MLQKLMPARETPEETPVKILCDFDKLRKARTGFIWKGKTYTFNRVTPANYMDVTLAWNKVVEIQLARSQGKTVNQEDVWETYYACLSILVPEFTFAEFKMCDFSQLNKMMALMNQTIAGDTSLFEDTQKKNP